MTRVQSVDDRSGFVFVGDANTHHSEWLESVSPTDRHRRDALDICSQSRCEQLVHSPTHIAGNRLDLEITDVPDIVDMVAGTPLGTSDHCIVSCALRVEQSAGVQCQKYCRSKASYQLGQCPSCSQEFYVKQHFKVS